MQDKAEMQCRRTCTCSMMRTRPSSGALHGHPTVLLLAVSLHSRCSGRCSSGSGHACALSFARSLSQGSAIDTKTGTMRALQD